MQGRKLTIYMRRLHFIRIHNRHASYSGTTNHLRCIRSYSTKTHYKHVCLLQTSHLLLTQ